MKYCLFLVLLGSILVTGCGDTKTTQALTDPSAKPGSPEAPPPLPPPPPK